MNEEWWETEERRTLSNYTQFAKVFQRIQEIIDVINKSRKQTEQLVVWDPGDTYCAVSNKSGSLILWYVDLASGRIIGSRHGVPVAPAKGSFEEQTWRYNIWHEDPTQYMSLFGVIKGLPGVPYENDKGYGNDKLSKAYMNYMNQACYKSDRVYTNYALEA